MKFEDWKKYHSLLRLHFFELEEFYLFSSRVSFESAVVGHQQDLLGGVFVGDVEGVFVPSSSTRSYYTHWTNIVTKTRFRGLSITSNGI
jgi:hypothetical protein